MAGDDDSTRDMDVRTMKGALRGSRKDDDAAESERPVETPPVGSDDYRSTIATLVRVEESSEPVTRARPDDDDGAMTMMGFLPKEPAIDETAPVAIRRPADDDDGAMTMMGFLPKEPAIDETAPVAIRRPADDDGAMTMMGFLPKEPAIDETAPVAIRRPADDDGAMTMMGFLPREPVREDTLPVATLRKRPEDDDAAMTVARFAPSEDALATMAFMPPREAPPPPSARPRPVQTEEPAPASRSQAFDDLDRALRPPPSTRAAPRPSFASTQTVTAPTVAAPPSTKQFKETQTVEMPSSSEGAPASEPKPTSSAAVTLPFDLGDSSEALTLMRPGSAAFLEFVASLPPISSRAPQTKVEPSPPTVDAPFADVTEDESIEDLDSIEALAQEDVPDDLQSADVIDEPDADDESAEVIDELADDVHVFAADANSDDSMPAADVSESEIELLGDVDDAPAEPVPFSVAREHASITAEVQRPQLVADELDTDEERALMNDESWEPLIELYRKRVAETTTTPKLKTALLHKIARVYESGLGDPKAAFDAIAEAFEMAPEQPELIADVDRLGKETNRIGVLADRLRKKVLPRASDEMRAIYLGHLVYWYERVLGRGREVTPLVADIERHDKTHPVVLKRTAQLAALNGDVKGQREHLLRALERTIRKEERVALNVLLGEAFADTPDALKYYEEALETDPACLPALQAMKRIGREKENFEQVRWALERQVAVVATDGARVEALLELADLEESKFLKRDIAAELFERVLELAPGQATALKGLERCYHALREWPKLAHVLALRAEKTADKKAKTELLLLNAEVLESKLGDAAGALEVYRSLLKVDPKHRRVLSDIARLYEKLGDWSNHATYRARLAELAPTKRAMSQELVKLGEFLDMPDRDRIAARLQYERAVVIDPGNVAGWEALQRAAAEAGDERRVIECLEQRRNHTDVPRQRANVLVELGRIHLQRGDQEEGRKAFEAAIRADSSNEAAAIVMLDMYTAEARWADAAPLAELLVNAAIRDQDSDALFVRLRLATRIAAALGDADRAMLAAVGALDARPTDPAAQADLVSIASQCRASAPSALTSGHARLAELAAAPDALSAENMVRLAAIQRDVGDFTNAAALLERAREQLPDDATIPRDLAEVYVSQGDFARATKLKLDLARSTDDEAVKFELLCEAGEIWARRAGELERAVDLFEEARALKPLDAWLLQTLRWLYGELDDFPALAAVLEQLPQALPDKPSEQVEVLVLLAELCREKLEDPRRAIDAYECALDVDNTKIALFEEIVQMLTAEGAWERLEKAYRRMAARVHGDATKNDLEVMLLQQLGILYRDQLEDPERAYEAFDGATKLRPSDADLRRTVIELLVATDNLDAAVARMRDDIDRDPHDPSLYSELYELFLRQHSFDGAWCAVNVLAQLQSLTPEQNEFLRDYAPMPLGEVPGQIVEQAWRSHVFHADLEPTLTSLFELITPVVARIRLAQLRPEQRVGRPFTPKHSRMHDAVRTTFENASEILSVAAPDLLLADANSMLPFAPALAPYGAVLVNAASVEARSASIPYLVGKCLAEQRPELAARGFFPTVPELTSLLNMALRVARNEPAKDPTSAALDASFLAALEPEETSALQTIAAGLASGESTRKDVKAWLRAADFSSTRAGLLVSGDVEAASVALGAEPVAPGPAGEVVRKERIGELYKFAVGELYAELRTAIGVAVKE